MNNKLVRRSHVDPSDSRELMQHMSADALREGGEAEQLVAAIRSLVGGHEAEGQQLAYGALLSVMEADTVKFVRDDDGQIWPFVPGKEYWRGPLRLTEDQQVQQARFYPDTEKIDWCSPWDKPSKMAKPKTKTKAKRKS